MANEFPTPGFGGPPYMKYLKLVKDYKAITDFAIFDDEGMDTNQHAADAAQRWELSYAGLSQTQAKTLDDHYITNKLSATFSFQEPRDEPWTHTIGTTYTGVRYDTYERPEHEKVWSQSRRIVLIKSPA